MGATRCGVSLRLLASTASCTCSSNQQRTAHSATAHQSQVALLMHATICMLGVNMQLQVANYVVADMHGHPRQPASYSQVILVALKSAGGCSCAASPASLQN